VGDAVGGEGLFLIIPTIEAVVESNYPSPCQKRLPQHEILFYAFIAVVSVYPEHANFFIPGLYSFLGFFFYQDYLF